MVCHNLKIKPEYFWKVQSGIKRAELRKNDRDFKVFDEIALNEFENGEYTGRFQLVQITDITDVSEYAPGYVLLSIEKE